MPRLFTVLFLVLIGFSAVKTAHSELMQPVALKPLAVVDGPIIRLGDLFEGLGDQASTPIARAPVAGTKIELNARWLAAVAQNYGVPWRPQSHLDSVMLERSSQKVETRLIEDQLRDALSRRGASAELLLKLDNPDFVLHLPKDAAPTVAVTALNYNPTSGRFSAQIVAPSEGLPLTKATVTGRAVQTTEIPVLRHRKVPGDVIRKSDIEWIPMRADRLARNVATDAMQMIGKSPRHTVRPGYPVRTNELRDPVVIEKNSLVTIRLEQSRMILTVQGRALEEGTQGDVIRVMNTKSNKTINAIVANSSTVHVLSTTTNAIN